MMAAWRYISASVAGTSHLKRGLPCQDASECWTTTATDGEPLFCAVVSDGAGSARRAKVGSQLACSFFRTEVTKLIEDGGTSRDLTWDFARDWLGRFQGAVGQLAVRESLAPRDFACTLLAAVVAPDRSAFLQIGDGAIVACPRDVPDQYCVIEWPQRGEYENTTNFATDPLAGERLYFDLTERPIDEIAWTPCTTDPPGP